MKIEVTVCNVDQAVGEPTKSYTLSRNGESVEVDLCEKHAAPIEALFGQSSTPESAAKRAPTKKTATKKATAKKASTRRRGAKVVSLDEIEAMKQG